MNYLPKCLFVLAMLVIILIGFPSTEMMTSIPTTASYENGKLTVQLNQDFINSMSMGEKPVVTYTSTGGSVSLNQSKDVSVGVIPVGAMFYLWCGERQCIFTENKIELPPEAIILSADMYDSPNNLKAIVIGRGATSTITGWYNTQKEAGYRTIVRAKNKSEKLVLSGDYLEITYDDVKKELDESIMRGGVGNKRAVIFKEIMETMEQIQGKNVVRRDDNVQLDNNDNSVKESSVTTDIGGDQMYIWCGEGNCSFYSETRRRGRQFYTHHRIELPPKTIILNIDRYGTPPERQEVIAIGNRGLIEGAYSIERERFYVIIKGNAKLSGSNLKKSTYNDIINESNRVLSRTSGKGTMEYRKAEKLKEIIGELQTLATGR